MKVIGLTGGIACGKSTVSAMLQQLGAVIIDSDKLARQVVEPGRPAWQEIVEWLGQDILTVNQQINRGKLGEIVFASASERLKLEAITHPRIKEAMEDSLAAAQASDCSVAILDVPLLFESGWHKKTDANWVVWLPFAIQMERLMKRDALTESQAKSRISSQMNLEKKRQLANIVIDNSHSLEYTRKQVVKAWQQLF
ncbi:MAG: coaE [Firmicutes bacterium]|nr:coaE [Bacillota bacterium]